MSIFQTVIFLAVLVIQDGHPWPTKLQQRDVDLMLNENAESNKGELRDKKDFNPSVEQDLEELLHQQPVEKRSYLEDELNKLLNPEKRENSKISEKRNGNEERKDEQLRNFLMHPVRNHKKEEKQLNELSKPFKKEISEHPAADEKKNLDHKAIRGEEETSLVNHDRELREKEDHAHSHERNLHHLRSSKDERHDVRPPIKKESSKEDYQQHYKEILRELHPPQEDEEEEREVHGSVQNDKKEKETSQEHQQRKSNKRHDDHKNGLQELHPFGEGQHLEREIHPPGGHEEKDDPENSRLIQKKSDNHKEILRKVHPSEEGKEDENVRGNEEMKKKEHSFLFSGHKKFDEDDIKSHKEDHKLLPQREDSKLTHKREPREAMKDDFSEMKIAKRNLQSENDEEQDRNMLESSITNQEKRQRYWTSPEEDYGRGSEKQRRTKEIFPGEFEEIPQLDSQTPFYERDETVNEDRSLDDEGLQDFQSRAEGRDLHRSVFERQEDNDQGHENEMEDDEQDEAERTSDLPNVQEEQQDEATTNEQNDIVEPSQLEPNTIYQDEYDDSEEEYQKKRRLLASLELMSLMARNKDDPSDTVLGSQPFFNEDTNDGTNIKRISPPLQIHRRFKDFSMPRRNAGIEPFVEPMQPFNQDEMSEVHAFEDEEDGSFSRRDNAQNAYKMERVKSLCDRCCSVERCWMIDQLHCDC